MSRQNSPSLNASMPAPVPRPVALEALSDAAVVSEPVAEAAEAKAPPRGGAARKVAIGIVAIFGMIMSFHVLTDMMAPTSSSGSVAAFTAQVAPRVAGEVRQVYVQDNQRVKAGDPLLLIDPAPLDLTVRQAEANFAQVVQTVDASSASLISLQAKASQASASLDSIRSATDRTLTLLDRGLASQAQADAARADLSTAEATLEMAEADLTSAMLKAGVVGDLNPQVQLAQVQLEQAQLNRLFATVRAPADGVITNLKLATGQYINIGTPALTFIESERPWVMVDLRENQLANVDAGDEVRVMFDAAPGRTFAGRVQGIAWGIDPGRTSANGLPQNQATTRWFEPARTIPVHIELTEEEEWPANVRVGSKASALIYASGTGTPVAWLASGLQTAQSVLSYLY